MPDAAHLLRMSVTGGSSRTLPVQSFARRRFRWRGAIGILVLVPVTVMSSVAAPALPDNSAAALALQLLAWLCFVGGASFRFWATLYVGGRKERELVTDGPYSLCRHPLYLGSLLLGVSGALFLSSPALLVALLVVALIYVRTTIPIEEAVLRTRHGDLHEAYVQKVPLLLPRTLMVETRATITLDVHRLWLECLRASRWMWLPVLGAAITYLRSLAWWPRLPHLL